jgi:hypothetical protein
LGTSLLAGRIKVKGPGIKFLMKRYCGVEMDFAYLLKSDRSLQTKDKFAFCGSMPLILQILSQKNNALPFSLKSSFLNHKFSLLRTHRLAILNKNLLSLSYYFINYFINSKMKKLSLSTFFDFSISNPQ